MALDFFFFFFAFLARAVRACPSSALAPSWFARRRHVVDDGHRSKRKTGWLASVELVIRLLPLQVPRSPKHSPVLDFWFRP